MPVRVLVVDDDPTIGELVHEVLATVDVESVPFTDSSKAAAELGVSKFDAIFLDVNMPSPNGIELTQKIRSGGLNSSTPIVVITGEDDKGLLARAFSAGANFFLYKPVDRHDILRLVRATHGSVEHERRRFRRVKVQRKVTISCGSQHFSGVTLDISLGGLFVQASNVLAMGSITRVSVELEPGDALSVSARVLRVTAGDCMGLQFETLSVKEAKRLQDFLLPLIPKDS